MKKSLLFLLSFAVLLSCQKEKEILIDNEDEEFDTYGYVVDCLDCDIKYVNEKNSIDEVKGNKGKFVVDFNLTIVHKLEVSVSFTNSQFVKAEITKNGQAISEYSSFQNFSLTNTGGSNTGSNPSNPAKPSTPSNPTTSSVCGAKNKTGGYCKRKVVGGGRCWQHR